jgi:hypothetical protein
MKKPTISKYLIPLAFVLAIVVTSLMSWQEQSVLFRGGTNPLFRSLSEGEVWIRRGFDPAEVSNKNFFNAKGARTFGSENAKEMEGAEDYGDIRLV